MLGVGLVTFTWISNFFLSHLEDSLLAQFSLLSSEWIDLPRLKYKRLLINNGEFCPSWETRAHVMSDFHEYRACRVRFPFEQGHMYGVTARAAAFSFTGYPNSQYNPWVSLLKHEGAFILDPRRSTPTCFSSIFRLRPRAPGAWCSSLGTR